MLGYAQMLKAKNDRIKELEDTLKRVVAEMERLKKMYEPALEACKIVDQFVRALGNDRQLLELDLRGLLGDMDIAAEKALRAAEGEKMEDTKTVDNEFPDCGNCRNTGYPWIDGCDLEHSGHDYRVYCPCEIGQELKRRHQASRPGRPHNDNPTDSASQSAARPAKKE